MPRAPRRGLPAAAAPGEVPAVRGWSRCLAVADARVPPGSVRQRGLTVEDRRLDYLPRI